jgi:hypothetical protein
MELSLSLVRHLRAGLDVRVKRIPNAVLHVRVDARRVQDVFGVVEGRDRLAEGLVHHARRKALEKHAA